MVTPYDYVQIITDDNWGLVGIIPTNGSNFENPFKNKLGHTGNNNGISDTKKISLNSGAINHQTVPEATVINKRRPIHHINSKKSQYSANIKRMADSFVTPSDISINGHNFNPDIINGINALEHNIVQMSQSYKKIEDNHELELFGEISNLTGAGNMDNILIGFGR